MASTMGFSLLVALFLVTAVAAVREDPFAEEKTYAPPYGSDPPSSASPVTPTPDVPYSPPYTPSDPSPTTPYTPDPSTPATPAPSTPGTCTWWSKNTNSFPNFISILSTILDLFGTLTGGSGSSGGGITNTIASIFGGQTTVLQGLTNTRNDGYGALARQGSAALLNSLTRRDYPYNALQVKAQFRNALQSQQQAFATARLFENANIALGAGRH